MAADLQQQAKSVTPPPVREWHAKNHIPPKWFDHVVAAAKRRGFEGVTFAGLSKILKSGGTGDA